MSRYKKDGYLSKNEWQQLDKAYHEILERRSDGTGSAYGEHYALVAKLRSFGIDAEFEASPQVENFFEYLFTYNQIPSVY